MKKHPSTPPYSPPSLPETGWNGARSVVGSCGESRLECGKGGLPPDTLEGFSLQLTTTKGRDMDKALLKARRPLKTYDKLPRLSRMISNIVGYYVVSTNAERRHWQILYPLSDNPPAIDRHLLRVALGPTHDIHFRRAGPKTSTHYNDVERAYFLSSRLVGIRQSSLAATVWHVARRSPHVNHAVSQPWLIDGTANLPVTVCCPTPDYTVVNGSLRRDKWILLRCRNCQRDTRCVPLSLPAQSIISFDSSSTVQQPGEKKPFSAPLTRPVPRATISAMSPHSCPAKLAVTLLALALLPVPLAAATLDSATLAPMGTPASPLGQGKGVSVDGDGPAERLVRVAIGEGHGTEWVLVSTSEAVGAVNETDEDDYTNNVASCDDNAPTVRATITAVNNRNELLRSVPLSANTNRREFIAASEIGLTVRTLQSKPNSSPRRIVLLPSRHPFANRSSWQYLTRFIVAEETGVLPLTNEHVHHANHTINDDNIDNYEVVAATDHGQYHLRETVLRGIDGRFVATTGGEVPF